MSNPIGCAASGVWRLTYQPRGDPSGLEQQQDRVRRVGPREREHTEVAAFADVQMPGPIGEPELGTRVVDSHAATDERRDEERRLQRQVRDHGRRPRLEDGVAPPSRSAIGSPVSTWRDRHPDAGRRS